MLLDDALVKAMGSGTCLGEFIHTHPDHFGTNYSQIFQKLLRSCTQARDDKEKKIFFEALQVIGDLMSEQEIGELET